MSLSLPDNYILTRMLLNIGFSDKDAAVYLALLELGQQPVSVIARKITFKRSTIYLILEGLLKKGLVSESTGSNVKYFTAVPPDYLLLFIEKQRRQLVRYQVELEQYLPRFEALPDSKTVMPRVHFYDGIEGIERIMEDVLRSQTGVLCYSSIDIWFLREATKKYIESHKRRLENKQIPMRAIYLDTPMAREYCEKRYPPYSRGLTEFRWFNTSIKNLNNEINIYDNKVGIISLGRNEFFGVIIESKEIANIHRAIFETAWMSVL